MDIAANKYWQFWLNPVQYLPIQFSASDICFQYLYVIVGWPEDAQFGLSERAARGRFGAKFLAYNRSRCGEIRRADRVLFIEQAGWIVLVA